jgi:hypothetical protein
VLANWLGRIAVHGMPTQAPPPTLDRCPRDSFFALLFCFGYGLHLFTNKSLKAGHPFLHHCTLHLKLRSQRFDLVLLTFDHPALQGGGTASAPH